MTTFLLGFGAGVLFTAFIMALMIAAKDGE